MSAQVKDRFLSKIKIYNECWIWQAQIMPNLYGSFWMNGKNILSHRASWIIFNGIIPENKCICHKCDNPSCVNPDHLFLGTYKENTQDMMKKNRQHIQHKSLNKKQELEAVNMYENGISQKNIAKFFNVNQRTLWRYLHKYLHIKEILGEENGNSKLTEEKVLEIRRMYVPYKMSYEKLSKIFFVNRSTIERIIRRETWNHI